jgi:hypothetical protein
VRGMRGPVRVRAKGDRLSGAPWVLPLAAGGALALHVRATGGFGQVCPLGYTQAVTPLPLRYAAAHLSH